MIMASWLWGKEENICKFCGEENQILSYNRACNAHLYCIFCLSRIVVKRIPISDCNNCNKYSKNIEEESSYILSFIPCSLSFRSNNVCQVCGKESKKCRICKNHELCGTCLFNKSKFSYSEHSNDCKVCMSIVENSCRSCFLILKEDEKYYKQTCGNHFYCKDCRLNKIIDCENCRKEAEILNEVQFTVKTKNICVMCKQRNGELLECYHIICEDCIKERFFEDALAFLRLITNQNINELNRNDYCVRCPIPGCVLKHILPVKSEWTQQLVARGCLSPYAVNHLEDVFNGVRFEFRQCSRCFYVSGHIYGVCAYCLI